MKKLKKFAVVSGGCLFAVALAGCENLVTRGELRETDQKKQIQEQVSTLQKSTADVNSRFSEIEQDLRSLNGRVEVTEAKLNQSSQETIRAKALTEQSHQDQAKKVEILQEEVSKMQERLEALTAEMVALKAAASESTDKVDRGGKKDHFEIGEDHFSKKDWRKAILSFQKFRDANPKSKKFAEATLKIGFCFEELGMKDEAKTFFDEVLSKYPGSSEAKKARAHLKSLKKN